ncbi:hypothetical protein Tco_1440869 [Tanacetum coccineum]
MIVQVGTFGSFSILDRPNDNLKTIWIVPFRTYLANAARFERPKASTFQKEKPVPSGNVTGFKQSIVQNQGGPKESYSSILKPSLVLDDSCLVNKDLTNCVMGEVLQFSSIITSGMIELKSSKSKLKFMEHVGVASWFHRLCNTQSDFAAKERIVWVDIEGVPLNAWTHVPEKELFSDDESAKINELANNLNNDEVENASEVVSDTYFGDNGEVQGFEHQHGSNSKVLDEAKTPWTESLPESFRVMGLKNQGMRFILENFRRNDYGVVKQWLSMKFVLKTWRNIGNQGKQIIFPMN